MAPQFQNVSLNGEPIENVTDCDFLGSLMPGSASEIHHKIGLARSAFERLKRTI